MSLIDEIRTTRMESRKRILDELFEVHYKDVIAKIKNAASHGFNRIYVRYKPHVNSEINVALAVMLFHKLRSEKFSVTQVDVELTVEW